MAKTILKRDTATEETTPKMGVFTTAEALTVLWNRAKLQPHELEWFASGAAQQVILDTDTLSEVLMGLGSMIATDTEAGSFKSGDSVSDLMFNLSSQLSTLNGLAGIAADASYRVRQSLKGQQ